MIYILFGNSEYTIKKRIDKIVKTELGNSSEIVKLTMNEKTIGNLIDEYDQFSLSGEQKVIVAYDSYFLETSKPKHKLFDSKELKELVKSIESGDNVNSIIFVSFGEKIDSKNGIVKYAKQNGKIMEFKEPSKGDWNQYVHSYFAKRNVTISEEAIVELIKRTNYDLYSFNNEATKLLMYKANGIDIDDINELIPNALEDDVFSVLNNLISGNKKEAIKIYRDLRVQGVEPVTLINLISSSLIYLSNVKNLSMLNYKADEIAVKTGSSNGRVFMAFKNLKLISEEKLDNLIATLHKLDYQIKHNLVDRFVAFDIFLANF